MRPESNLVAHSTSAPKPKYRAVTTNRVIVRDYRGAGGSSKPEGGYDKATMASDIRVVLVTKGV